MVWVYLKCEWVLCLFAHSIYFIILRGTLARSAGLNNNVVGGCLAGWLMVEFPMINKSRLRRKLFSNNYSL